MSQVISPPTLIEFLKHILPDDGLYCHVALKKGHRPQQGFVRTIEELAQTLQTIDAAGWDAYFACSTFESDVSRKAENVKAARCFWLDIDYGSEGHSKPSIYATEEEALAALDGFCQHMGYPLPTVVSTGGGLHAYWRNDTDLDPQRWVPQAEQLKIVTRTGGLDCDPNRTADSASILRAPGTHNYKIAGKPRSVECIELMEGGLKLDVPILSAPVIQSFNDPSLALNKAAAAIYVNSPPAYAAVAATKCAQLAKLRDEKGNFEEPLWYAGLGILAHCVDGEPLAQEWSSGHPEYEVQATTAKLSQARNASGPTTCERFKGINPSGCIGCPFTGTSPIQLGREEKQSSLPSDLAAIVRELAALPPYAYDQRRKAEADKYGLRLGTLDDLVEEARPKTDDKENPKNGRPLSLPPPEPWPDAVDGAALLDAIVAELTQYVILCDGTPEAIALWIMHSHVSEAFFHTPRLVINSPVMRCGKSTLLRVIKHLVPKQLTADNISSAALFRTIEQVRPTLLIDEADSFAKENEELRGIVNSGHQKDGSVIRTVGDDHEPRAFSTWCPLVLAAIGKLPGTIEDRAIIISMRRRKPEEKTRRFKPNDAERLHMLCRAAARWAIDNIARLSDADPAIPEELNDRAMDNWRSMLAIADAVGGAWPERARRAALTLSGTEAIEDRSIQIKLLEDIRGIFDNPRADKISSANLCGRLVMLEGAAWAEWYRGKPISQRQLARLLDGFKIKPKDIRHSDGKIAKGYERGQFDDAFSRYLS